MTEGFSAKDIAEIVTKAMMEPVRIVETATHFKWVGEHSIIQHRRPKHLIGYES